MLQTAVEAQSYFFPSPLSSPYSKSLAKTTNPPCLHQNTHPVTARPLHTLQMTGTTNTSTSPTPSRLPLFPSASSWARGTIPPASSRSRSSSNQVVSRGSMFVQRRLPNRDGGDVGGTRISFSRRNGGLERKVATTQHRARYDR